MSQTEGAVGAVGGALAVVDAAGEVLVQDAGRAEGWRASVGRSGYADRTTAHRAHRLAGNDTDLALLEIAGSLTIAVANRALWCALDGGSEPARLERGDRTYSRPAGCAWLVEPGDRVVVAPSHTTYRRYLAIRGGLAVPATLGSRSCDTLAAIGPPALRSGDVLRVLDPSAIAALPTIEPVPHANGDTHFYRLHTHAGPHDALAQSLLGTQWAVTGGSRVGIRLSPVGHPPRRPAVPEFASFPVFPGCVQLTSGLEALALGVDAPLTGGYPVPLVIDDSDLDLLGRCRLGDRLEFVAPRFASPQARSEPNSSM